jgi:hypothetical protein
MEPLALDRLPLLILECICDALIDSDDPNDGYNVHLQAFCLVNRACLESGASRQFRHVELRVGDSLDEVEQELSGWRELLDRRDGWRHVRSLRVVRKLVLQEGMGSLAENVLGPPVSSADLQSAGEGPPRRRALQSPTAKSTFDFIAQEWDRSCDFDLAPFYRPSSIDLTSRVGGADIFGEHPETLELLLGFISRLSGLRDFVLGV